MTYVLMNKETGNYFKKEIINNEEGRCVDVNTIEDARKFDSEYSAKIKSQFIGGVKYTYIVIQIN